MKKIETVSRYYYTNNIELLTLPPFSEIKKAYINGSDIYIIYEFPIDMEFHDQRKLIKLKVQEFVSAFNEPGYQYLDTQIIQKTELQNSSFSNNIQLNIINIDIIYHFFIQENKPQIEMRDEKINDLIN
jgi:hypothetical protein